MAPPQFAGDGSLTPDLFAVNTMQPAYQPSGIAPAAGGDTRPCRSGEASAAAADREDDRRHAVARRASTGRGTRGHGTRHSPTACSRWRRSARSSTTSAAGSPNFQPHHQPFNYFARYAPGTVRARAPSQGLHRSRRRHRRRQAAGRRVLQAAGQSSTSIPATPTCAAATSTSPTSSPSSRQARSWRSTLDHHHLRRERRLLGPRRAACRRPLGTGDARADDPDRADGRRRDSSTGPPTTRRRSSNSSRAASISSRCPACAPAWAISAPAIELAPN